jgi:hypothetical protein
VDKSLPNSVEASAILQRMEEVRCELDEDVQDIVEDARDLGDWRSYVKRHPWICLGAAFAAGYFVVPPRAPKLPPDVQTASDSANQGSPTRSYLSAAGDARGMLLSFVGNLVMRQLASFAMQQAEKFLVPPDKQP